MIIRLHPETPQARVIDKIAGELTKGKIYILPTDTVYALVCSLDNPRAINQLYRLKKLPESHHLTLLCKDLAMVSHYAHSLPNSTFRLIKSLTPGPVTFILRANRLVDRRGSGKKRTVGIRIVDHPIHQALMEKLDTPLASTSITIEEELATDPEELELRFGHQIEAVIDGGIRYHEFSTILDCTEDEIKVIRQGCGDISHLGLSQAD